MRIGCLGLSANPPHRGHASAASLLLASKKVDEVWLIPVFNHAFRKSLASWEHRLAMCRILERNYSHVYASPVEAEIEEQERHGVSYTLFTVRYLKEKFPHHAFYWCVGSDIILDHSYLRWYKWAELQKEIEFLVLEKPGYPLGAQPLPPGLTKISGYTWNTSSTKIRQMIREGKDVNSLVPHVSEEVARYIKAHGLYKPNKEVAE